MKEFFYHKIRDYLFIQFKQHLSCSAMKSLLLICGIFNEEQKVSSIDLSDGLLLYRGPVLELIKKKSKKITLAFSFRMRDANRHSKLHIISNQPPLTMQQDAHTVIDFTQESVGKIDELSLYEGLGEMIQKIKDNIKKNNYKGAEILIEGVSTKLFPKTNLDIFMVFIEALDTLLPYMDKVKGDVNIYLNWQNIPPQFFKTCVQKVQIQRAKKDQNVNHKLLFDVMPRRRIDQSKFMTKVQNGQ